MKTGRAELIVVVEDEEELRRSLTFTLLRNGYRIRAHANAVSAIDDLQKIRADSDHAMLLISDIQMPGLNGIDTVTKARRIFPDLPVLIITGHANKEIRKSLLDLGVIRILDMPFHLQELMAEIERLRDSSNSAFH